MGDDKKKGRWHAFFILFYKINNITFYVNFKFYLTETVLVLLLKIIALIAI